MESNEAEITHFLKLIMVFTGTWRHKLTDNKFKQTFYTLYSVIYQASFLCFFIALIMNFPVLLKNTDVQVIIDYVAYIIFVFMMLTKIIISQSSRVRNLILRCTLEEIRMYKEDSETIQGILIKKVQVLNRIIIVLLLLSFCTISAFWNARYVEYNTYKDWNISIPKPMTFPIWYPFNENKHYGAAIVIDIYFGWISVFNVIYTQVLFYTLMTYAVLQISALKISAMDINLNYEPYNNTVEHNKEKEILTVLRNICIKHQSVISFVDELNTAIKNVLLLEFILNSLNIAAVLVQILILPTPPQILGISVFFLSLLIYQLFMLSWQANEIQIQSMSLSETLFHSKWYDQSEKAKQIIHIIMLRSRQPLSLFIGPFYPMTTSTALSSLKAAYSYVAMVYTLTAKESVA